MDRHAVVAASRADIIPFMNPAPRIADLPTTIYLLPLAPWLLLPETVLPVAITAAEGRAGAALLLRRLPRPRPR
jgi:hypothetical protein